MCYDLLLWGHVHKVGLNICCICIALVVWKIRPQRLNSASLNKINWLIDWLISHKSWSLNSGIYASWTEMGLAASLIYCMVDGARLSVHIFIMLLVGLSCCSTIQLLTEPNVRNCNRMWCPKQAPIQVLTSINRCTCNLTPSNMQ